MRVSDFRRWLALNRVEGQEWGGHSSKQAWCHFWPRLPPTCPSSAWLCLPPGRSERAEMAALHHRRKKELADVAAALAADYAEARAEAAAAYRLMVGGWEGEGPYGTRGLTGRWQRCGTCQPCALHPFATCLTPPPPPALPGAGGGAEEPRQRGPQRDEAQPRGASAGAGGRCGGAAPGGCGGGWASGGRGAKRERAVSGRLPCAAHVLMACPVGFGCLAPSTACSPFPSGLRPCWPFHCPLSSFRATWRILGHRRRPFESWRRQTRRQRTPSRSAPRACASCRKHWPRWVAVRPEEVCSVLY